MVSCRHWMKHMNRMPESDKSKIKWTTFGVEVRNKKWMTQKEEKEETE